MAQAVVLRSLRQCVDTELTLVDDVLWVSLKAEETVVVPVIASQVLPLELRHLNLGLKGLLRNKPSAGALQTLADFVAYLSAQTYSYALPYSTARFNNSGTVSGNPANEEAKREIRSLKGLVLNRHGLSLIANQNPDASS